mmetsp:Transcript_107361/g.333602  ORF Transcript_107361/g.333602 Transcript_107361/m.333602 type:complete len:511 (-) Transcript_107361:32-1564(-)
MPTPGGRLVAFLQRRGKLAGSLAVILLLILKRLRDAPRKVRWLRGPPLLGVVLKVFQGLREHALLDMYDRWHQRLGPTFAYCAPGKMVVATIDPKNIEHVLKTKFDNYVKGHVFAEPFTDLLGDGIFNADGEMWHRQRKTASRMFTKRQFETHIWKAIEANTAKVGRILERSEGTLDMFNLMNRFTLDTIGRIGFSKDIGSLEDPSSPFLRSFDRAQQILILRFWTNPAWKVLRWLGVGWERELKEHLGRLDGYARGIVRELRQKAEAGQDDSFVGLFMKEEQAAPAARSPELQEKFMRDLVLNFLIAGRDTTAQCISWTLFELTQHPAVAAKARQEVLDVCGEGPVTFEHLKSLQYVRAILDEGLRLHPSVPYDGKLCLGKDTLPDGTVVPAGCIIQYIPYAQGRCKDIWGEDACSFRPERWLEMPRRPSSFAFAAFNAGPRECLGRRLAEAEMAALVSTVVRDFDMRLEVEPSSVRYDAQLTLGMCGLPVSVRRCRRAYGVAEPLAGA